ncbi:major facilitator superfamily transporter [Colletotrichum graminicola M1.001]|uniref:Major facilitator superfamily transporter n=1 Tax=Colletotrichum graminicola (strain M1.001 / M2 / FGSC 10212) TaxID=645133 RepID=E3QZD2_COLGM|nr:major facilitator superfamily transporter [Colletotrichum graminicola M1.001]EFQ36220.1 major facilitator superfamily transporter [Colletotrichum graminicola M1.001]
MRVSENLSTCSPEEACMNGLDDDSETYPEGGRDAWLVVVGAWCAMFSCMGLLNTLAVLQAWITEHELHGLPESTIGWVFSTYAFFLYFCGAQVGPLFDAYKQTDSARVEFYQFFLTFGVIGGISASLLFNPSIASIGHWFCKRRGIATGIACTAGGVGGVVFPLIILYMAPKQGFPWAIRTVGFICAAASVLACSLLRKRLPPNRKGGGSIDLKALTEGVDLQRALLLNALLNVGAIPGRGLPGYVADRFGCFNVMCITTLICSAFILGLWLTTNEGREAPITAFAVLYGFWSGAAISRTPVCVGQVCKTEDYGKRSGTAFFVSSLAALVGVPFAGAILQWSGGAYHGLILFAGGLYILAFCAFAVARGVAGG